MRQRQRTTALRRSVHVRHVDAGSDGSEEWEIQALLGPVYDIHRLGVFFTASPRHADVLLVTGAGVLHTRAELREVMMQENGRDGSGPPDRADPAQGVGAAHLRYASDVMEVVETYLYRPALAAFLAIVTAAKRLQSGRLDAYLLYMLIALIAVIAVATALA